MQLLSFPAELIYLANFSLLANNEKLQQQCVQRLHRNNRYNTCKAVTGSDQLRPEEKKKQLEQQQSKGKNGHADDNPSKRSKHDEDVSKALMAQVHRHEQASSALYFRYNTQLGPPYHILIDTNFINFALQNRLEIIQASMDCLLAKCIPCITDCVMAELEKLGRKYRIALKVAKDPRFVRLACLHKGTYADDCLVHRHKCYIVATCDRDLKRRIRKIPGVPIMYISQRKFAIERMPEVH
eukprot:gene1243-4452_t